MTTISNGSQSSSPLQGLSDIIGTLQADNQRLQDRMKILAVQMNVMANWICDKGGVQLFNKESDPYKTMYLADDEQAKDIEKKLTSVPRPPATPQAVDHAASVRAGAGSNSESNQGTSRPGPGRGSSDGRVGGRACANVQAILSGQSGVSSKPNGGDNPPMKNLVIRLCRLEDEAVSSTNAHPKVQRRIIHLQAHSNTRQRGGRNKRQKSKCRICQKVFAGPYALRLHEQVHTGQKLFQCRFCDKRFTRKDAEVVHMTVHTNERPYHCETCGNSFSRPNYLKYHQFIHTGEKPFSCRYCKKTFRQQTQRRVHERVHTGEKPFSCQFCAKVFATRETKLRHERCHTGEKPFKCHLCDKTFRHAASKWRHERLHTGQ